MSRHSGPRSGVVDLGVDVGTTHVKVLALDPEGGIVARAGRETVWEHPRPEWTELDPENLMAAVLGALSDLVVALPAEVRCRSLGVTGMAETGFLLDEVGRVMYPGIAWHDPRSCRPGTLGVEESFVAETGLPVNAQATAFKLGWVRDEAVDIRGGTWLTVPEYVVHRLGGDVAAERSLAGRTGLIQLATGQPWGRLVNELGVRVPPIRAAGTSWGIAEGDALPARVRGAVLTVAGHDHAVAAVAAGVTRGAVFDSVGTAEAVLVVLDDLPDPASLEALAEAQLELYPHVIEGQWAVVTGTRSGLALNRVLRLLDIRSTGSRDALDAAALMVGERRVSCCLNDDALQISLDIDDLDPAVLWRSAVEACAVRMRERLDVLTRVTGAQAHTVVLGGGWSRLSTVVRERADWANEVVVSDCDQPGLIGAATFAARAAESLSAERSDTAVPQPRREVAV